jgi:uncharacterized protein
MSAVDRTQRPLSPGRLRARIEADARLAPVWHHVQTVMRTDPAHDLGHLLRVAAWTIWLIDDAVDVSAAIAAALLHDVVNVAKSDAARGTASERSAEAARALLDALAWDAAQIDAVVIAIRQHSWSRGEPATSRLAIALRDADRLEALGVIGTFRCIATGAAFGSAFVDIDDPWASSRELDDKRYAIDHFFVKLLGLVDGLALPRAQAEGARRVATMRALLHALGDEIGTPFVS